MGLFPKRYRFSYDDAFDIYIDAFNKKGALKIAMCDESATAEDGHFVDIWYKYMNKKLDKKKIKFEDSEKLD